MGVYWDGDGIVKLADVQAGMGQEYPRDYPLGKNFRIPTYTLAISLGKVGNVAGNH